jgi:VIT1/CCC1 family predicted Fe2+/Mn2+ transporter
MVDGATEAVLDPPHHDEHFIHRTGWLRAAVLGANDGIVSTASLLVGVAASGAASQAILLSGIAALVAGAMSMAAGEYVSVSAQAETERADLAKERAAIASQPDEEHRELRDIYIGRGLDPALATQVAAQLMAADALGAHARDELGISDASAARPIQAALTSAASFAVGALPPVLVAAVSPSQEALLAVTLVTLVGLLLLGYLGAWLGGAKPVRSMARTLIWGALAMLATAGAGRLFGAAL